MLDYERLDVYQCALRFASCSFALIERLPRGHAQLADQLRRATMSIPLNIAEGSGKTSARERSRFHAIARGSAMECGAVLDILRLQRVPQGSEDEIRAAKELLERVVAMLSRMSR